MGRAFERTEVLRKGPPAWATAFREVLSAPGGLEALRSVLRYIRLVTEKEDPARVKHVLGQLLGSKVREAYVTEGERLIQQGIEQGIEQGIGQGRIAERLRMVLRLLEVRFGPLPTWAQTRLEAAGGEELERYAEHVLTASSLEEVFAAT